MNLSQKGVDLIKEFEGFELEAYKDGAGIWTIGYGTIQYEDGSPIKKGDAITKARAEQLMVKDLNKFVEVVNALVRPQVLGQNKFDALVSLCYNIGASGFGKSTALKLVLADPSDPHIADAFKMWAKITVNGILVNSPGLLNRRTKEAEYYFS